MNVDDCYRELGVAPGASEAEVKAAWRRLAAMWHPDRNDSPQALQKIQRINRALEVIRSGQGETASAEDNTPDEAADTPIEIDVHLTLEDVATGCTRVLQGEVPEPCADCEGSGLQPHPTACSECGGAGRLRQPLWFGWAMPAECGVCHGQGATRQGCPTCSATGKTTRKYRCRVQIPAGVHAGDCIDASARLQGDKRKHPLALRLRVHLLPHEFFTTQADGTVSCELPVDGFAWIANRWIEVPTLRGLQQMRLSRGNLNYRIRDAGLPWQDDGACADCIVTVVPLFPETFSAAQEAAIDRLIAGNSRKASSAAGERIGAWNQTLKSWHDRISASDRDETRRS